MEGKRRVVVWVVDDTQSVREALAAVLESADISARVYASAESFLAHFTPGSADCLVLDHHMPDMTGLELLQLLRGQGAAIPAILISGQGDGALRAQALKAGAAAMLHKPVDGDELIVLIERLLA